MEPDYGKLGFRCGIEIHQQLSGKKLFCGCDAINSAKDPDIKIKRRLRAVAGETGKIDAAARHEMKKGKQFVYVASSEDTCLVEFDDEPPHPMNQAALDTAIEVAQMLGAKIVDEIQVMRKTVVDGSNTSGFQRTALVGYDGHVDTSKGKVRITNICIEEEAAQKLNETESSVTYKLDRLGIALIEIGTEADIKSPEHAKETAEKLGLILRSTGKVKRGLGTIRQDVNISIKGGARTEIKGFQDLRSIPKVIKKETERQLGLIRQNKRLKPEVRKAEPDFTTSFLRPMPGAARMYPETDIAPVKPVIKKVATRELIYDIAARLKKQYSMSSDLANAVARSDRSGLFESLAKKFKGVKPGFIAEVLVSYPRELARDYSSCDPARITEEHLQEVFTELDKGTIAKGSVLKILADIALGKKIDINKYRLEQVDDLEESVRKIVEKNKDASVGAIMGEVMKKYRGRVDGKQASELVKRFLKEK